MFNMNKCVNPMNVVLRLKSELKLKRQNVKVTWCALECKLALMLNRRLHLIPPLNINEKTYLNRTNQKKNI